MSTIVPPRTPAETWWPMPTTRAMPSSTFATKQAILVEPTSSAATRPLRGFFLFFFTRCTPCSCRLPGIAAARRRRRRRLAHGADDESVGIAQVDDRDIAVEKLVGALDLREPRPRGAGILLGQ